MNGPGNMVAMNAAGGPVGGPVMNQAGSRQQMMGKEDQKRLNTYIYDYMLKNEQFDLARAFYKQFPINQHAGPPKSSPGKRELNGVDDMDTDSKDSKRPADLPEPNIPPQADGSCFLYDWWCQFWDIFGARNNRSSPPNTADYLNHNMMQQRQRSLAQKNMVTQSDPRMVQNYNSRVGMTPNGLMQAALNNSRNAAPPGQMQPKPMQGGQMRADGSAMDMGGQRPQSPSIGNTPSPSKRPRLDETNGFNGQPVGPAGRGQPISGPQMNNLAASAGPNAPGQMMLQNGITGEMQAQQMGAFSAGTPTMQQKQLEAMNAAGMAQQGQMPTPVDGSMEFMNAGRMGVGAGNQAGGNHALQDYQMQLMLLEQQNKKRLLMARQEQDNISNHPGQGGGPPGGGPPGPGFAMAPAMSPSGSRAGPSPNPNDQMRRGVTGTPKMGPGGSPMPDMGQNRGSPAPNFDPNQMPPNMNPQYYAQMNGNMMGRPPSSHPGAINMALANMSQQQIEQVRIANGGRLPGQPPWPPGAPQQMMQQAQGQPQQPQQQMGTPQQRHGNMPPPPAPTSQEQPQRTQPSSPATQNQGPPTPSQAPKANPKGKKEGGAAKPAKKNAPKKQGTAGATPAADNAEPPTPTPSTPITPMHPNSFNKGPNGPAQAAPPSQQLNGPQGGPAAAAGGPPPADGSMGMDSNASNFGMFGEGTEDPSGFDLSFNMNLDSTDVLDNFDFDSLLNADTFSFGGMGDEAAPTTT